MMDFIEEIKEREQFISDMKRLYQNKKNKKFYITDVSIKKIPYEKFEGIDNDKCFIIHELCEYLLKISKENNDSNEVSITYNINNELTDIHDIIQDCGICFGTIDEIELLSDTRTMSILNRSGMNCVINMHNHPSCFTFSLEDIRTFLKSDCIKIMIVICNNGEMYYMNKLDNYDIDSCYEYLKKVYQVIEPKEKKHKWSIDELKDISRLFLKNCSHFGIKYYHVVNNNKKIIEE